MSAASAIATRPMITHQWRDRLDGSDLEDALELVRTAWDYDAEAGFTRVEESLVRQASEPGSTAVRHLLVRGELDDLAWDGEGGHLLAYLHLRTDGADASVRYVVHPDHRSRGVTTMLVEELGLEIGDDGWAGSGARAVRGWALGHHPAAERFARRFGLDQLSRTWQMVRHLTGPFAEPLSDVPAPVGATVDGAPRPVEPADIDDVDRVCRASGMSDAERQQLTQGLTVSGGMLRWARHPDGGLIGLVITDTHFAHVDGFEAGTIRALAVAADRQEVGLGLALLVSTLATLQEGGAQVALFRIDPARARAVRLARLLSFERDKDDACYGFGDAAQRAAWTLPDSIAQPRERDT